MYKCGLCGSTDVEIKMWVNVNTLEISGDAMEDADECWCNGCEQHSYLVEVHDEDTNNERGVGNDDGDAKPVSG